jgi:hypothetical protein
MTNIWRKCPDNRIKSNNLIRQNYYKEITIPQNFWEISPVVFTSKILYVKNTSWNNKSVYVYNGSNWILTSYKIYNGSNWI